MYDGNDDLKQRFLYADDRVPYAMTQDGTTCYLAYDQVGSLRLVTDSSGTPVKQLDYDSFGNIIGDTHPAFTIPFGFAGGLQDSDTGLVRFGYRDYMPEIGKWTAKDPILFAGGDTNLFGYVLNDPVNFVDPEGLWSETHPHQIQKDPTGGGGAGAASTVTGIGAGLALGQMLSDMMFEDYEGSSCPGYTSDKFPPGFWPGDKGAEEWGRRNNIDKNDARRRFHDKKKKDLGSEATDPYGVNPDTGDIVDPNGEYVDNLGQ